MDELQENMLSIIVGYSIVNLIWNIYSEDYIIVKKIQITFIFSNNNNLKNINERDKYK